MTIIRLPDRTYSASLAAFSKYAGVNAPRVPEAVLSATQVDLHRWAVANFPGETAEHAALGLAEELAELEEALEVRAGEWSRAVKREIGDVLIHTAQLCTMYRLDLGELLRDQLIGMDITAARAGLGAIARTLLKSHWKHRGFADASFCRRQIAEGAWLICRAMTDVAKPNWEATTIFVQRAAEVLQRDWVADPITGAAEQ